MKIVPAPHDLRAQYEAEQRWAARIRAAPPALRAAVTETVYSEFHSRFARAGDHRLGATPHKEHLLNALLPRRGRILEFGCGHGDTLAALAGEGREVLGSDVSEAAVAEARRRFPHLRFVRDDGAAFEAEEGTFDAVFCVDVIEHLHPEDVPAHLARLCRCLKPGGLCVVMTPHARVGPHDVSRFFSPHPTGLHLREYSYRDLASLGRRAGFARPRSPLLPFRCYRFTPRLAARSLVPAAWKESLEAMLRLPFPGRVAVFKILALHTVCLVMRRPPGRRDRDAEERT